MNVAGASKLQYLSESHVTATIPSLALQIHPSLLSMPWLPSWTFRILRCRRGFLLREGIQALVSYTRLKQSALLGRSCTAAEMSLGRSEHGTRHLEFHRRLMKESSSNASLLLVDSCTRPDRKSPLFLFVQDLLKYFTVNMGALMSFASCRDALWDLC